MPTKDTSEIKEKIVSFVRRNGPSLPVHIAKEIGESMLFASAFLSELMSEKKLKTSNLKVGNSPLYLISGQEFQLEKFSHYLKSKEKEAFDLLRENKFLKDENQEPAIRVALRAIKDFAIPFKKDEEVYFRYLTIPEENFEKDKEEKEEIEKKESEAHEKKEEESLEKNSNNVLEQEKEDNETIQKTSKKELDIFDKKNQVQNIKVSKKKKSSSKTKSSSKVNEKFFNRIKEYLLENEIEILDIVGFSKNDLTLKVKFWGEEKILVAYNKKSVREEDITKAYKKAQDFGLKYIVLSLGEPLKKLNYLISAIQNLEKIEKVKEDKN